MQRYSVTLTGVRPLLMHNDDITFSEKIAAWRKAPENRSVSVPGDDRSPAFTWIGYLYHNRKVLGIPSDNIMTMLREGGSKLPMNGKKTYKAATQSGILCDSEQFDLLVDGKTIDIKKIMALQGNNNFDEHLEMAEKLGFELFVKRAKIGTSKHVRVRPQFRTWQAVGTITIYNPDLFVLHAPEIQTILNLAGQQCGLCDWRPSSKTPGSFGMFEAEIKEI